MVRETSAALSPMQERRGSIPKSGWLAWQRLKTSLSETEPKDLVKFIVISICLFLVYVQIVSCYGKLNNPGITTHTELRQNETMEYPALTICREPPFDRRKYEKYSLGSLHAGSYPLMNQWKTFKFDNYTLTDFFTDAVYNETQVFEYYGLQEWQNQTRLKNSTHLTLGTCFTIEPLNYTKLVGKKTGFTIIVKHDLFDYKPLIDEVPGWNIFFHQSRELFSENKEILTGRQDHLFVRVNEEVEVNLEVVQFENIKDCNSSSNYSSSKCEEDCWIRNISQVVNCSAPWFPSLDLPECNNYVDLSELYKRTIASMNYMNCCMPHCSTKLFTPSVVSRTSLPNRYNQSRIYIYYSSKALLTMEEHFAYDWNLFLADLGGSLGFLLGLSVIGVVSFLEEIVKLIWGGKNKEEQKGNNLESSLARDYVYKWRLDTQFKISPSVAARIERY